MADPERLLRKPGPAARLLRSAELDVPGAQSRARALAAAAGAVTALGAATGSAAVGGTALAKMVATWVCVGALGGTVVSGAALYLTEEPLPPAPRASQVIGDAPSSQRPSVPAPAPEPAPPAIDPEPVEAPSAPPAASVRVEPPPSAQASPRVSAPPARSGPASAAGSAVASFSAPAASVSLHEELKWIEAARSAAARGDHAAVLATLDRYEAAYPGGHFRPEAQALRIEALAKRGDRERARTLAERFIQNYPTHPLIGRVRAAIAK